MMKSMTVLQKLFNIWCMLDWILSQKCRNTISLHTVDQLVRSVKNDTVVAGWNKMCKYSNLFQGYTFDCAMW